MTDYKSGGLVNWLSRPVCVTLCLALALMGTVSALRRPPLADVAWQLYLAAQNLDGARLDVDYLENNPPLIVWLATAPVAGTRMTGIAPYYGMLILLLVLSAVSLVTSERLLARLPNLPHTARNALVLSACFAVFILPRLDFTQREHLALVLTLPWMCLAMVRSSGKTVPRGAAAGIGLAGAIGFALKPYFLFAWLLVEAYLVYRTGKRVLMRTELITLVGAGLIYVAAVLVLTPGYLPFALAVRPLYQTYLNNGVVGAIVLALITPLPLFLLAALAHWNVDREPDAVRDVLLAATLGFFFGAIAQQKGWRYHYVAALGYGFMLLAAVVLRSVKRPSRQVSVMISAMVVRLSWLVVLGVTISVSAATLLELRAADQSQYREDPNLDLLLPVVRREAAGQRIMVFSSNPASGWPLTTEAGALWSSRYLHLWQLAALYHHELWDQDGPVVFRTLPQRTGLERQFHDAVIEDLERYSPRLLVVLELDDAMRSAGGAARLDYLKYFGEDPRFVRFFSNYDDIGRVGLYRLYRRRA